MRCVAGIESNDVIGGCKHHALNALPVGGLKDVIAADDVGIVDRVPRAFGRMAAEMHDAVDVGDDAFDLGVVGEVGEHEVFIIGEAVRLADVTPPDGRIDTLEQLSQARADAARGSGDEDFFHLTLLTISAAILTPPTLLDPALCGDYFLHRPRGGPVS